MTSKQTTKRGRPATSRPPQIIEWEFTVGPPRRPWQWYLIVLAIGLGLAGLFFSTLANGWTAALGMLLWTGIVVAASLAPSRSYHVTLDRNLLTVTDAKRQRKRIERNLAEFATYKLDELPADRLNPIRRTLTLRPRSGALPTEVSLTGNYRLDRQVIDRIADAVAQAPTIAPTLTERFGALAERWVGWR